MIKVVSERKVKNAEKKTKALTFLALTVKASHKVEDTT